MTHESHVRKGVGQRGDCQLQSLDSQAHSKMENLYSVLTYSNPLSLDLQGYSWGSFALNVHFPAYQEPLGPFLHNLLSELLCNVQVREDYPHDEELGRLTDNPQMEGVCRDMQSSPT